VGSKSDYLEAASLDWALGGSTPTRPTTRYLALYTADPGDANGGTEVSLYGYARQAITFGAASGTAPCTAANTSTHTFTNTGGGSWGTIAYWAIMDASTAGNQLYNGAATTSRTIAASEVLTVAAGAIVISED
jgi:hypothetical protein